MSRKKELKETADKIMQEELERAIKEKSEEIPDNKAYGEKSKERTCHGHRERTKKRFIATGLSGFAPHEMLELLLFYAIPQRDTKPIAHDLIQRFGSVAGVFDADISELIKINGITENSAVLFKLIPQMINVYYSDRVKDVSYNNSELLTGLFRPHFVGEASEKFLIATFNCDLKLMEITEISRGTAAAAAANMKKIMSAVIKDGCTMAALAHNHPGGEPFPSDDDIAATIRITELLAAVDVQLMDHIIIGMNKTYSMRDKGDMSIFN